ncbi:MFS general substrate transporter [Aspergillus karnatakaensis]|uniref:MFS general substrate transporter n=1 Tax=Aspergillus karnatakaensis TaxID=1810916 RepID=UPI003CCDD9CA
MPFNPKFRGRLRLTHPFIQNFLMGCILFCLPGIYLALTGLGAGGGQATSQETAALTNSILYGVYTIAGWCAGPVLNHLKPKWTIILGGIGYPIYVGSLWYYDRVGGQAFPLTGGAILGVCAGLLWTASGFIQFAYPEEHDKGMYITWQWVLTSAGSTVGALIAFVPTIHETEAAGVSNAVYIAFLVIMASAIVAAFFLIVDPADVRRSDGRHIAAFEKATPKKEILGILSVITDLKIIILLPAMFVGEMCLALTSSINGTYLQPYTAHTTREHTTDPYKPAYYFNLRTRTLNNLLFQAIMIPSPFLLAWLLDNKHIQSRKSRGLIGTTYVALITLGATSGLLAWVFRNNVTHGSSNSNATTTTTTPSPLVDWTDSAFTAGIILYLLFGIIYACFQIVVQWTLAALTNDPALCARYAGAFKGTVSLGMCVSFTVDSQGMAFRDQVVMQLVLYAVGIGCLGYVVLVYVQQTNYLVEEGVVVPNVGEGGESLVEGGKEKDRDEGEVDAQTGRLHQ